MPTLSRLLPHHARYRGDAPALDFEGQCRDFASLNGEVNRLANALLALGLKQGDRFATVLPNSFELMAAYWAAAVSGLVIVPCSVLLQSGGLRTLLADAGARVVFGSVDQAANLEAILGDLPDIVPGGMIITGEHPAPGFTRYTDLVDSAPSGTPGSWWTRTTYITSCIPAAPRACRRESSILTASAACTVPCLRMPGG